MAAPELPGPLAGYAASDLPAAAGSLPGAVPQGKARTAPGTVGGPQRGAQGRTWTVELPAGMKLLNANDRDGHWARRQNLTAILRETAGWLAKQQHIPRLERAHILGVYQPPDRRKRDPANYYPSFKACVDGIIGDAKVLPGDDAAYLDGPDMRLGEPYPRGRLVLHVTEVAEAEAGAA